MALTASGAPLRPRDRLADVTLVGVAGVEGALSVDIGNPLTAAVALVICLALFARRRWPYPVLALTLPGAWLLSVTLAALIALFTVASYERDRRRLAGCALAVIVCNIAPSPFDSDGLGLSRTQTLAYLAYLTAMAAAPVFLGQLRLAHRELAERLKEIIEAREQEDRLLAQTVLAVERAQLAREMHDVVSHQVSLIAVHAGALQVGTAHPATREAAETIRELSVETLDELRHMVTVLRASGGRPAEITPQPGLGDLPRLVAGSGLPVQLTGALRGDLGSAHQRAIYRTIQEALTNIRKHAPGASTTVHLDQDSSGLTVTVTNTAARQAPMNLPSAGHGLIGLRERAQLLGGTLSTGATPDQGYRVQLRLLLPGAPAGTDATAAR